DARRQSVEPIQGIVQKVVRHRAAPRARCPGEQQGVMTIASRMIDPAPSPAKTGDVGWAKRAQRACPPSCLADRAFAAWSVMLGCGRPLMKGDTKYYGGHGRFAALAHPTMPPLSRGMTSPLV